MARVIITDVDDTAHYLTAAVTNGLNFANMAADVLADPNADYGLVFEKDGGYVIFNPRFVKYIEVGED